MAFEQLGQTVPVEERELGWDDTIEKESAGFIILPEGDYEFKVLEFQRTCYRHHPGYGSCKRYKHQHWC